ncbi:MAG: hypothetical protein QW176_08610 [Candidatus Bathyarchaeia archaeon]
MKEIVFGINKFKLFIKEKVREKIKNLAENFWEIIKNEEEW